MHRERARSTGKRMHREKTVAHRLAIAPTTRELLQHETRCIEALCGIRVGCGGEHLLVVVDKGSHDTDVTRRVERRTDDRTRDVTIWCSGSWKTVPILVTRSRPRHRHIGRAGCGG